VIRSFPVTRRGNHSRGSLSPLSAWRGTVGRVTAHVAHAMHTVLLFAPSAVVFVGGIPGAGKTTFLARTVRPGDAVVLDSACRTRCTGRSCTRCTCSRSGARSPARRPSWSMTAERAGRCGGCSPVAPPGPAGRCTCCCSTSSRRSRAAGRRRGDGGSGRARCAATSGGGRAWSAAGARAPRSSTKRSRTSACSTGARGGRGRSAALRLISPSRLARTPRTRRHTAAGPRRRARPTASTARRRPVS
jgi:hypothetical protein